MVFNIVKMTNSFLHGAWEGTRTKHAIFSDAMYPGWSWWNEAMEGITDGEWLGWSKTEEIWKKMEGDSILWGANRSGKGWKLRCTWGGRPKIGCVQERSANFTRLIDLYGKYFSFRAVVPLPIHPPTTIILGPLALHSEHYPFDFYLVLLDCVHKYTVLKYVKSVMVLLFKKRLVLINLHCTV